MPCWAACAPGEDCAPSLEITGRKILPTLGVGVVVGSWAKIGVVGRPTSAASKKIDE